jgi:hypothetical protein
VNAAGEISKTLAAQGNLIEVQELKYWGGFLSILPGTLTPSNNSRTQKIKRIKV